MGLPHHHHHHRHHPPPPPSSPLFLLLILLLPTTSTAADIFTLVYKGCSTSSQATSPGATSALSSALIAQSATAKFYKTTASNLFGLFQCRGDLSPSDCSACVSRIPPLWASLCGPSAAAARVHLNGCYALYQVSGFPQVSGTKMLYKYCSTSNGGNGEGFEEKRGTAFANLQSGVASSGSGFYATGFGSVYAMAQCEGDLSVADCGECVTEAVQKAEVECGGSTSGQMYLDKCFITYSYYPNGVPRDGGMNIGSDSGGSDGGGGSSSNSNSGVSGTTGKTVAIVVGGAAGVGFLVICLLFVRSLYKKDDY